MTGYQLPVPGNQSDAEVLRLAAQILRLRHPADLYPVADKIHFFANTLWPEEYDEEDE